mgnify:CR=1 FL=1
MIMMRFQMRWIPEKKESRYDVIANTIKGKGLACAENQAGWHHKTPSLEQVEQLKEDMAEYRKELA